MRRCHSPTRRTETSRSSIEVLGAVLNGEHRAERAAPKHPATSPERRPRAEAERLWSGRSWVRIPSLTPLRTRPSPRATAGPSRGDAGRRSRSRRLPRCLGRWTARQIAANRCVGPNRGRGSRSGTGGTHTASRNPQSTRRERLRRFAYGSGSCPICFRSRCSPT